MPVISAPVVPVGQKPTPASWLGPSSVPGNWWDGLLVYIPFWEGAGVTNPAGSQAPWLHDVATVDHAITGANRTTADWQYTEGGIGYQTGAAVNTEIILDNEIIENTENGTWFYYIRLDNPVNGQVIFSGGDRGDSDASPFFRAKFVGSNNLQILWRGTTSDYWRYTIPASLFTAGQMCTIAIQGGPEAVPGVPAGNTIWVNGVQPTKTYTSGSASDVRWLNDAVTLVAFDYWDLAHEEISGQAWGDFTFCAVAYWDRKLNATEMLALSQDPYAPIRSHMQISVGVAGAEPPAASPVRRRLAMTGVGR